jgi:hypothetical protein
MKRYDRGALVIPLFFYGARFYERSRTHNVALAYYNLLSKNDIWREMQLSFWWMSGF